MRRRFEVDLRVAAAVLLGGLVAACATFEAPPPHRAAIRTVGIISAVGDAFTLTRAGLTGPDQRTQRVPIAAWKLDDLIESRTAALLAARFQVRKVAYQRAVFAGGDAVAPDRLTDLLRPDPVAQLVRSEAQPQGLDAYVVVTKARSTYGGTARAVAGVGLVRQDTVLESYNQIHALYLITLIDGRDFHVIARRTARPPAHTEPARLAGPSRIVDDRFLPAAGDAERDENLKSAIAELIERSLPETLQDLQLVDPS